MDCHPDDCAHRSLGVGEEGRKDPIAICSQPSGRTSIGSHLFLQNVTLIRTLAIETPSVMRYFISLLFFLWLCAPSMLLSQSCLPEGITFNAQAQIDSFQINHPNCFEIEGSVEINGDSITNLLGLSALTGIGGGLLIDDNPSLTNLNGLDNINYIGEGLYIGLYEGNSSLNSLNGLNNLNTIGSHLNIFNNDALTNLSGLENITSIDGLLRINLNDSLTNLLGLNNIYFVSAMVEIEGNNSLTNLAGLSALDSIWGNFVVIGNPALTNLVGINNLTAVGGSVRIVENDALLAVRGLNSLESVGNNLEIRNNALLNSIEDFEMLNHVGNSFDLHFNPSLKSLSGLDNLTTINMLFIGGNSLNTLDGLHNLTTVTSLLSICEDSLVDFTDMSKLTKSGGIGVCGHSLSSLSGFENIDTTGQVWIGYSENLHSLSGLKNLVVNNGSLSIVENESLTDLNGLENLTQTGRLNIKYSNLSSLEGLNNCSIIKYGIDIDGNSSLQDISALSNVFSIANGDLRIINNPLLTSLYGLDNIAASSIDSLYIYDNTSLSTCEVKSICDYLLSPNGVIEIYNNATGCNTQEEVEDACEWIGIPEQIPQRFLTAYPNPFIISTTIEYELKEISNIQFTVYNVIGERVHHAEYSSIPQGLHTVTWSPGHLPGGMYYAVLRSEAGVSVMKMVKQ